MTRAILLLCLLVAPLSAADPAPPPKPVAPAISGETKVLPYKLVRLRADNLPAAAGLLWDVSPDEGVDYAGPTSGPDLVFVAPPGSYRCECIVVVVVDGKPALSRLRATVVIGTPEPPKPPEPPTPPTPTDPLLAALQAAYAADTDPDKAARVSVLSDLFASYIAAAKRAGNVGTLTQLQNSAHAAAELSVGSGKIMATRKAIAAYLSGKLGTKNQLMTDALWAQCDAEFAAVAKALKGVK